MEKIKRLPYGISNFESIRTENFVYIDKTRFIKLLEEAKVQLEKYLQAFRLAGRPGLQGAAMVFIGKNKFEIYSTV